jgi:hypothetical protein
VANGAVPAVGDRVEWPSEASPRGGSEAAAGTLDTVEKDRVGTVRCATPAPAWRKLTSPFLVWFAAFVGINYVALALAMGAHGAGFDDCDGTVLSGEVVLPSTAELAWYGVVAVGASAGLAVWRLKGRQRTAALVGVSLSAPAWLIITLPAGSC